MKRAPTPPSESPAEAQAAGAANSPDVALIHGVTADGGLRIIRRRGDRIEAGAVQPVREGAPLHGEVIALKPRKACPLLCDVEVQYTPPRSEATPAPAAPVRRKGPAQVSSNAYRDNWDSIWRRAKKNDSLN